MKMNERFLQEAREIEAKWLNDPQLKKFLEEQRLTRGEKAVLMEGQRLVNEQPTPDVEAEVKSLSADDVSR